MEQKSLQVFQETIRYEGEDIWIKPLCDFFEISYKWQVEVIRNDHILSSMVRKNWDQIMFGDKRSRVLLPKKGFIRWIQLININTIREDLRPGFAEFQKMVFDFLYGSPEIESKASVDYLRLKKMKRLYAKLGREIQLVDRSLNGYLENKFQLKIQFDEPQIPRAITGKVSDSE